MFRIVCFIVLFSQVAMAQSDYQMKGNDRGIDVNFLSSYYRQDGNNSAVEGGIGSEELIDAANIIIVNIPLDSIQSINVLFGADFYSSASTDRIDANVSSESIKDLRAYANIGYTRKSLSKGLTYGIRGGVSKEYDYTSINGGINIAKEWNQGNSELGLQAQAFIDKWTLFLPAELRRNTVLPTDKRNSFNLSGVYSQVLNQKMQVAFSAEAIYMTGLLSTPFHRVYFANQDIADVERLPDSRLKIPVSVRFNYFPNERFVIRSYYRFYTDDFGVKAHTANIEVPIKINDAFSVSPFFRYHTQEGSKYFAPYKTHVNTEQYYSSDYDLSTLSSKKYGVAFGIYPLEGFMKGSLLGRSLQFKSIELRLAYYERDTGLKGYLASVNFSFKI